MQLIRKFNKFESEHALFELGREQKLPIWSILRYHVFLKYYLPEEERKRLATVRRHPLSDYFLLLLHLVRALFKVLFHRAEYVIITASRSRNSAGEYFDKSALAVIELLGKNALVLEAVSGKKLRYDHIYDFVHVFRRFYHSQKLPREFYRRIDAALASGFGANKISYEELNLAYHTYQSDLLYYRWLFRLKRTRKVFIAEGNPKAVLRAAQERGATTYLLQHGSIEVDDMDFSYAAQITPASNVLFADYVLTLGDYWCKGFNVPARRIVPIGNDFFYSKPDVRSDESILVISTIVHGGELRGLTRQLAELHARRKFVYKLHPNEFHFAGEYVRYFAGQENVTIVMDQADVNILVARSQLVVLIVSTVLYEALNQDKKVAIYKRLNYERQSCAADLPNVFFFGQAEELSVILATPPVKNEVSFFKPTDVSLLREIIAA